MVKIIFATGNKGKVNEIREILKDSSVTVLTMKEAGYDIDQNSGDSSTGKPLDMW